MATNDKSSFEVGDTVVYPPHGAGTIVEKGVQPDGGEFLSIHVEHTKMTLRVPAAIAAERGVRKLVSNKSADALLKQLAGDEIAEQLDNRQQRIRAATDQARTGDAAELVEVIRDLHDRQAAGSKLSPAEQTLMQNSRQMLASEILLVKKITAEEAEALIDKALGQRPVPDIPEKKKK